MFIHSLTFFLFSFFSRIRLNRFTFAFILKNALVFSYAFAFALCFFFALNFVENSLFDHLLTHSYCFFAPASGTPCDSRSTLFLHILPNIWLIVRFLFFFCDVHIKRYVNTTMHLAGVFLFFRSATYNETRNSVWFKLILFFILYLLRELLLCWLTIYN